MDASDEIPDVHRLKRIAHQQTKTFASNTRARFPHNEPLDIHI